MLNPFYLVFFLLLSQAVFANEKPKPQSDAWILASNQYALIGTTHNFGNIDDPQLVDIENYFNYISPEVVVLEGGIWPNQSSKTGAINCCGEMGFLSYLAHKDNIEVVTWEPPADEEINSLKQKYKPSQLKLFYLLRQIPQLLNDNNTPLAEQVDNWLKVQGVLENEYKLASPPYTYQQAAALVQNYGYKLGDFKQFDALLNDNKQLNEFHDIKRDVNSIRDQNAIKIKRQLQSKNTRFLMLMGKAHFRTVAFSN
ncbi:MAG: hypothetical protein VX100_10255 [Pseudomonadota bacterium]|nr:hypothetical protein [Pseudomonadota bacterium]